MDDLIRVLNESENIEYNRIVWKENGEKLIFLLKCASHFDIMHVRNFR